MIKQIVMAGSMVALFACGCYGASVECAGVNVKQERGKTVITVDGIPFSKSSETSVMDKAWRERYFTNAMIDAAALQQGETTYTQPLKGNCFNGSETVEVLPDRKVRIAFDGTFDRPTSAQLQLIAVSVEPEWFAGAPYTVTDAADAVTTGVFPINITYGSYEKLTVARGFKQMEIASPYCTVTLKPFGSVTSRFVDYRGNPFSSPEMQYIVGAIGESFDDITTFSCGLEIGFGPITPISAREFASDAPVVKNDLVLKPKYYEDRVAPTPKNIIWNEGVMALTVETNVTTQAEEIHRDFMNAAVANLTRSVKARTGVKMPAGRATGVNKIVLTLQGQADPARPDLYKLNITPDAAMLESPTTSGLICAIQSFRQLMRPADKAVRCATIEDWADMPLRGIHFFTGVGESARDTQVKLIHDILGELKLNTLVYECSYIKWKSLPPEGKYVDKTMDIDFVKAVIEAAREEFIEIVPLINSYGHSEWFLENDKRARLADDPSECVVYDATTTEVYALLEPVYRECFELFRPRAIHIGHDEVGDLKKPAAKAIGKQELYYRDVMHWYNYLKSLGAEVWMWSDMLYHFSEVPDAGNAPSPEEAAALRAKLPKDIVVCDWHYTATEPETFTGLKILNKAGFNAIAATWEPLKNITNFARAAAAAIKTPEGTGKTLGMIETTWAGYNFDAATLDRAYAQFVRYAYAAEMMWNGGKFGGDGKEYDWTSVFASLIGTSNLTDRSQGGFCVPLVGDLELSGRPYVSIPDCGPWADRVFVGATATDVGKTNGVLLSGMLNYVGKDGGRGLTQCKFPINAKASSLVFTGAVVNGVKDDSQKQIAKAEVSYDDNTTLTIPLRLGVEVVSLLDPLTRPNLGLVKLPQIGEVAYYLHYYTWKNPTPDKTITTITVKSENTSAALFLRGITGLD